MTDRTALLEQEEDWVWTDPYWQQHPYVRVGWRQSNYRLSPPEIRGATLIGYSVPRQTKGDPSAGYWHRVAYRLPMDDEYAPYATTQTPDDAFLPETLAAGVRGQPHPDREGLLDSRVDRYDHSSKKTRKRRIGPEVAA